MTDFVDPATRSRMMAAVKQKNTKPELLVRSMLHRAGLRFSLHRRDLPGKPDIVLRKYRSVVFVHGCYWHRHEDCPRASTPKSNTEFWKTKFNANVERDAQNQEELRRLGWRVFVVWECELKREPSDTLETLIWMIRGKP